MRPAMTVLATALLVCGCTHSSSSGGGFLAASASNGGTRGTATAPVASATPAPVASSTPIPTYGTRKCWPIVFVHGMAGFKNIGPLDYWMNVPQTLEANGFETFVVADSPFATIADRATEAMAQIVAKYPDPRVKVNLIGHSMGGLDCRYMVSSLGFADRVASVTTVGTPHHGSSVADVIIGLIPGFVAAPLNAAIQTLLGWDLLHQGQELTTVFADQTFNPANPDDPRVSYFSWTGTADPLGLGGDSIIELALDPTWMLLDNLEGPNDGLVSVKSGTWGQFLGTVPADHLSEVGQPLGITPSSYDYESYFLDWAIKLEAMGFGP
jgi:triacylglycerol lipase